MKMVALVILIWLVSAFVIAYLLSKFLKGIRTRELKSWRQKVDNGPRS
jgi:uncharacterized membrane protein